MKFDGRKAARVRMDHKQPVNLMGSDGTWRRSCVLLDVSQTGAKVEVEGTLDVLQAKEFFMASTLVASRRSACSKNGRACDRVAGSVPRFR